MVPASLLERGAPALRFAIVGGANFLFSWVLLWCLTGLLHWPYLLSTAVAFILGTLLGHRGNRSFTFRAGDQAYLPQLARYALAMLTTLALSLLIMWVLVDIAGLNYLVANAFVALGLAAFNFLMSSRWVFRARG